MTRIKQEAENILMFESELLDFPAGLPSISSLDVARMKMADEAKFTRFIYTYGLRLTCLGLIISLINNSIV